MEAILADNLDSVKYIRERFLGWADTARTTKPENATLFEECAEQLELIAQELQALRIKTRPVPQSYGDISDLPPELMAELSGIKVDELEDQIFSIVNSADEVDLDVLLIELFRRFRIVQTRKFLQNKTYRMAQKGIFYSVPRRKGVYTVKKPEAHENEQEPDNRDAWGNPTTSATDLDDEIPF